jgi:CO dehydrogenase nickel-insertion accessory protein CooC1
LVLQGKGGIGKTFAAYLLVQYHQHIGRRVKAFEADPVNASLAAVPALHAEAVELMDGEDDVLDVARTDAFIETLLNAQDDVVIDSGAASFRAAQPLPDRQQHR